MSRAVVAGEGGRDGLASLVQGRSTRSAIRRTIEDRLGADRAIGACIPHRVAWKPGKRLRAFYDATVDGLPVEVAVRWDHGGSTRTIEVWPDDGAWPHLAEVLHPSVLADALRSAGWDGSGEPGHSVIRYRPGQRHVVKLTGDDGTTAYMKIAAAGSATTNAAQATFLADACRAAGAEAARPSWWSDHLSAVASPAVAGRPLTHRDDDTLLQRVGALLRGVHAIPVGATPLTLRTVRREADLTLRACEHVLALDPALGPELRTTVETASTRLSQRSIRPVLLHGDAKIDHVFVDAEAMAVIDLDSVAIGDPFLDLGRMLASLAWDADPDAAARARDAVLDGYGAPTASADIDAWTALWLVKQAARRVSVLDAALPDRIGATLREARALLHGR